MKQLKVFDRVTKVEKQYKVSEHTLKNVFRHSTVNALARAAINTIVTQEYISCGVAHYEKNGSIISFIISDEERDNLLREIEYRLSRAIITVA